MGSQLRRLAMNMIYKNQGGRKCTTMDESQKDQLVCLLRQAFRLL